MSDNSEDFKEKRELLESLIDELSRDTESDDPSVLHDFIILGRRASFGPDGDRFTNPFQLYPLGGIGVIEVLGFLQYMQLRTQQGLMFGELIASSDDEEDLDDD